MMSGGIHFLEREKRYAILGFSLVFSFCVGGKIKIELREELSREGIKFWLCVVAHMKAEKN
jgi:hypothetical protein